MAFLYDEAEFRKQNEEKERKAIAIGAALLDRILPGWHDRIDLRKLRMRSGALCMMGQLFGNNVETALANEMYPEEMEKVAQHWKEKGFSQANGYRRAVGSTGGLRSILESRGELEQSMEELKTLNFVCGGHDNRCLWAEAIAERKAKDVASKEE